MPNQYAQWKLCSGIAQTEQCNGKEISGYIERFLKNVDSRYQMLKSLYSRKNYIGVRLFVTSATDLKDTERQMAHLGCMIDMISSK